MVIVPGCRRSRLKIRSPRLPAVGLSEIPNLQARLSGRQTAEAGNGDRPATPFCRPLKQARDLAELKSPRLEAVGDGSHAGFAGDGTLDAGAVRVRKDASQSSASRAVAYS